LVKANRLFTQYFSQCFSTISAFAPHVIAGSVETKSNNQLLPHQKVESTAIFFLINKRSLQGKIFLFYLKCR